MTERVIFVDKNDQPIGAGDRKEAWAKGYYTRNICVVLRDQNGRFLSQKRNMRVRSYAGMWTVAASGHLDEGETWDEAAHREVKEEIGVSTNLTAIGDFILEDNTENKKIRRIIHVYEGTISDSTQFVLQEDEVEGIEWYELEELKIQMLKTQEKFTPSFRKVIQKFY